MCYPVIFNIQKDSLYIEKYHITVNSYYMILLYDPLNVHFSISAFL
jgi:hypothetical protein